MRNTVLYWVQNLVGSSVSFYFNLLIVLFGGMLYTFGSLHSPFALLFFGVVFPVLFTLCIYSTLRHFNEHIQDHPMKKLLTSRYSNIMLMSFDISLILVLAALIHFDILNYLFFRLLQTLVFPLLMLFLLRVIYLMAQGGSGKGDDTEQDEN